MKYDFLVVGAGLFGSTFARKITDYGYSCLVIDKKPHIAGTAYDEKIENIITSKYGAHIFHTNNKEIWQFVNQYSNFIPFVNKPKVKINNSIFSFPINLFTLHQIFKTITPKDAIKKLEEIQVKIKKPTNFEEWYLSKVGKKIYKMFFYHYTKKQWQRDPKLLPLSIAQRLPLRLTYDENYFNTDYQGMPENGYSKLIENMLEKIDVDLNCDFFVNRSKYEKIARKIIFTGTIDSFFNYELGELEYSSLQFKTKIYKGDYQGTAVINHCDEQTPYLRSIEHKHFYKSIYQKNKFFDKSNTNKTVVTFDYPVKFSKLFEPYYPIRDKQNSALYQKYYKLSKKTNVIFGGRLGQYSYFDMDQTIASAIQKSSLFLNK